MTIRDHLISTTAHEFDAVAPDQWPANLPNVEATDLPGQTDAFAPKPAPSDMAGEVFYTYPTGVPR